MRHQEKDREREGHLKLPGCFFVLSLLILSVQAVKGTVGVTFALLQDQRTVLL